MESKKIQNNKKIEILQKLQINNKISIYHILNKEDNKIYLIRRIALKDESEEDLEKIKNEVKNLSIINCEYVIKFIKSFIKNNTFNIVTENYENISLRQFINKYKKENKLINQKILYHIIKEISFGLKEIHNMNIIHGNLNPDNLYFTKENKIKIGGFGIFNKLSNYNEYILYRNNYYNYNAPEIIKNEEITNKIDIWSLGCILYELCTLNYCFNSNNIIGLHNKIINENHGKINMKFYEPELQKLINLLLKKDPKERPKIKEICNLVIKNCDSNTEKKFEKKYGKSKIKMIIEIKEDDINKDIFFLDNSNYEEINGNIIFHDPLGEFNESNVKLYINKKKYRYTKYFRFAEKGEYNIKIKFYMPIKDCSKMFYNCKAIKSLDLSSMNTKNVINMSNMFFNCENLTNINLSKFNTQNVTNMSGMFNRCSNLDNIDLSFFNTKNTNNMSNMFSSCEKLKNLNLSNFNTQNVIDMSYMFSYCINLDKLDLSLFNTENVKNMAGMFYMCENLNNLNLSNFDTQNVENISEMFCHCENLVNINLSSFNIKNIVTMEKTFYNCYKVKNLDLSMFNTEKVENFSRTFYECKSLECLNISSFNIKSENNCFQMFFDCKQLKKIILSKEMDINSIEKAIKDTNIKPEIIYI